MFNSQTEFHHAPLSSMSLASLFLSLKLCTKMKMKVKIHLYFSLYVSKPPKARVLLIKKDLAREVWENVLLCVTVCYQALLGFVA